MNGTGASVSNPLIDPQDVDVRVSTSLDQTRRALVEQTAVMLIAVGLVAIAIALRVASLSMQAMVAGLVCLSICACSIALCRSRLPVVIAASCLIGGWLTALFVVAYLRGGLGAPLMIAVPIIPVIAATVISRQAAWLVCVAILIGLAILTELQFGDGNVQANPPIDMQYDLMRAFWVVVSSLMATKLATYKSMRNDVLTQKLQLLATTDALTHVANRRSIQALLETEVARAQRRGSPLAVLMLDVDHFKTLNDQNGHLAGDAALSQIAAAATHLLRTGGDAVGRWGGEEFLVILPHTAPDEAMAAAERIRRSVVDLGIRYRADQPETVTVTIGVAGRHCDDITSADELVRLADGAMYRGKAEGRNRVVGVDREANEETAKIRGPGSPGPQQSSPG